MWGEHLALYVILNAYWEALDFELPVEEAGMGGWRRIVDTSLPSPDDLVTGADAPTAEASYRAGPRSVVVLAAMRTAAPR